MASSVVGVTGVAASPVAIVGLGCVLPDAPSPAAFWKNTLLGHCALRPLDSADRDWRRYHHPDPSTLDRTYCLTGARVSGHSLDWRKYRISPAAMQAMNPMARYVLDAGSQALEGLRRIPSERSGIFLGATALGFRPDGGLGIRLRDLVEAVRGGEAFGALSEPEREALLDAACQGLKARLEPVSEDHAVNACASIAAGRIAMQFDLKGLHYAVDSGAASALAALEAGVRSLRDGTVDLAVVGGASELLTPLALVAASKAGTLGRERLRPFDACAEGTLLGEGAALFALKRLEDAVADSETVYAVVRGVGGASSGTEGDVDAGGQILAMRRAWEDAGLDASTAGFVECHAAGIPALDAAEIGALASFYHGAPRAGVALGAAKAFVGHLGGGAAAAGLLRAVLALHHRTVPPQIGFAAPHPHLFLSETPFYVPVETRPLRAAGGADRARAAVCALGMGGPSYHAVVESYDAESHHPETRRARPHVRLALEPVAVVGLGSVLPGSQDVSSFWKSLLERRDATREVPRERWDAERYFDPDPRRIETTYSRLGCFVDIPAGDSVEGEGPAEAGQVLAQRAAEEALADAGFDRSPWDRDRTAVLLGFLPVHGTRYLADARVSFSEFAAELERALIGRGIALETIQTILSEAEKRYKADLPPIGPHTLPAFQGSTCAARIARRFGLRGPLWAVDSACSSTLAALQAAVQGLRQGAFDTALTGGVWADIQPEFLVAMSRFHGLSPTGITPFDARASGFVTGEGAGILVLQRLADAERQGRRIHAVVRAVAGSSDGRGRSIFAPSADGEALAMRRAAEEAGLTEPCPDYLECHGTGTAVGDVVEIDACARAFGRGRPKPLLVGSVKSNLGHLMAASGVPALLKTVLAVREGVLPPSLKFEVANPRIDFAAGPVKVVAEITPWPESGERPRRAGVNSFGLGGTNYHAIVEQYVPAPARAEVRFLRQQPRVVPARTLPIAAAAGSDLQGCIRRLDALARSRSSGSASWTDALAASQAEAQAGGAFRIAVVADLPEVFEERLETLARAARRGNDLGFLRQLGVFAAQQDPAMRVAAIFPGQGPQYPNMLRAALPAFPELGETLDAIDRAYEDLCGRPLRPSFFSDDPARYAQRDEDVHCAVFAVATAVFSLFQSRGLRVDAVMGQSAGELAALVAAGTLSLEDGLRAVRERTLSVLALDGSDPGRMVGLACGAERAQELVRDVPGYAVLAADNGPAASIVSGNAEAIAALLPLAASRGIETEVLSVSHGYHSRIIAGAMARYLLAVERLAFRGARLDIISTVTGASIRDMPQDRYPAHLANQFVKPVRLSQAVEALYTRGARLFLECGPKWPLTTFVDSILSGRPHVAQATLHPKMGEVEQLHRAFACLFAHGALDLSPTRSPEMNDRPAPAVRLPAPRPGSELSGPPQPAAAASGLVTFLRGIRNLVDGYLQEVESSLAAAAPLPAASVPAPSPPEIPTPAPTMAATSSATSSPTHAPPAAASASSSPAPASSPTVEGSRERVQRLVLAEMVRRTGYPEEMLEQDLDLEGELGIDTVKQVAVLASVREQLQLAPDPTFRLRDANTLGKTIDYIARRVDGQSHRATPPLAATSMLALTAAALRTSAPKPEPSAVGSEARPRLDRALLENLLDAAFSDAGARPGTISFLSVSPTDLAGPRSLLPESEVHPIAGSGTIRVVVRDLHARIDAQFGPPPREAEPQLPVPPEVLGAATLDGMGENGAALRSMLDVDPGSIRWVRSTGGGALVAGARLDGQAQRGHGALAALILSGAELAAFGWYRVTGKPHRLVAIERIHLHRLPAAGEELGLHARTASPRAGRWRADVIVFTLGGERVAEMLGLSGWEAGAPARATSSDAGGPDEASWQRFCRAVDRPVPAARAEEQPS